MTEYGRMPKDYAERYHVVVTNHDGGWVSFDVVSVGRAYSLALWAVDPKGNIFKRVGSADANKTHYPGIDVVVEAQEQVNALAAKRKRDANGSGSNG